MSARRPCPNPLNDCCLTLTINVIKFILNQENQLPWQPNLGQSKQNTKILFVTLYLCILEEYMTKWLTSVRTMKKYGFHENWEIVAMAIFFIFPSVQLSPLFSSRVSLSNSHLSVVRRRRRPSSVVRRRPSVNSGTFLNGWTDWLETWSVGTLAKTGRTFFSFFRFNPLRGH